MKRFLALLCVISMLAASFVFPVSAAVEAPEPKPASLDSAQVKIPDTGADFNIGKTYITQKNPAQMPLTIEAWVNSDYDGTGQQRSSIFGNYYDKGSSTYLNSFSFRLWETVPQLYLDSLKQAIEFPEAALTAGVWTHVALTVDTAEKKAICYINGAAAQTQTLTDEQIGAINAVSFTEDNCKELYLGGMHDYSTVKWSMRGKLGSLAAYSDIRTADEIAADYLDYTSPDNSDLQVAYVLNETGAGIFKDISGNECHASWGGFEIGHVSELGTPEEYDHSIFVIGDTQSLAAKVKANNTAGFDGLYDWLAANIEAKKMQAIIGVGDITNNNNDAQYQLAVRNFAKLSGKIMHLPTYGNHDVSYDNDRNFYKNYDLFTPDENTGFYDETGKTIEGYYQPFTIGEHKYLFLGLSYAPTAEVRNWAKGVIEAHEDYNVIIATHGYLDGNGKPLQKDNAPEVREELVLPYSNVVLVLCGHMHNNNVLLYTEERPDRTTVQAVLTNPQDVNIKVNHGVATGLYFTDGGKTVNVVNHLVGTDYYVGTDSVRSFKLDLVENRNVKVPTEGIEASGLPAYTTQKPLSKIPMTVEAWVNPSEYDADGKPSAIFGNKIAGDKSTKTFFFSLNEGYPALDFGTLDNGTNTSDVYRIKFSERIELNRWTHVAFTVDIAGKSVSLYINGELKETKSLTEAQAESYSAVVFTGNMKYTSAAGLFAWSGKAGYPFKGQVASAAVYSDIRTAEEISADYTDYKHPDRNGLLGAYVFDNTGDFEYSDLSDNKNNVSWNGFTYNTADELTIPERYDYSMFVVGDIQTLTKRSVSGSGYLNSLYTWMDNNYASKKAAAIIGVGDITDANNADQWSTAATAFGKLGDNVVHMPILGNHDGEDYGTDPNLYKSHITLDMVTYTDSYSGDISAYYHRFTVGAVKYLFLGLGYWPSTEVISWAAGIIEANPDHNVIISTHAYLDGDGTLLDSYAAPEVREQLVLPYSNVVLVLCGHMHDTNVRLFTEERKDGTTVQAMFTNQQDFSNRMPHGVVTELYFSAGGRTVNVANYIPTLDLYLGKESVRTFKLDLIEYRVRQVENVITAEGFAVRMDEYTGLRGLFSFDEAVASHMISQNFELVSYGVVATSYNNFVNTYGGDENAFFEVARAEGGYEGPIKYIPVYNSDGSGANRYVDRSTKTFCVSLVNIDSENVFSDIYMAGYVIWKDKLTGNETVTLTTYAMDDGAKAVNLYEITLGLTKTGVINSENTDDACFWQVLKLGALTTDVFNTANDNTEKKYELAVGDPFTYLDVDWHEYTGGKKDGYAFNPTAVSETASGVVWSILKYTDDEYVLILRNKDKTTYTDLAIPQSANKVNSATQYKYYAPYDYRYGDASNLASGAVICTYNPALTQADFEKIKTYVVDYGISVASSASFAGFTTIDTVVYPNGFSAESTYGNYMFAKSSSLKNVIWCHEDANGVPIEHMSEFKGLTSLADLRGFAKLSFKSLFNDCTVLENAVLGTASMTRGSEKMFINAKSLKRFWNGNDPMPKEGIIDLTGYKVTKLENGMFACGATIKTIMLPDTVTSIDSTKYNILGENKEFDFICSDSVKTCILNYVTALHTAGKTTADKIKVNGVAVTAS